MDDEFCQHLGGDRYRYDDDALCPRNTAKSGHVPSTARSRGATSVIGPPARQELGRCRIAWDSWNMAKRPRVSALHQMMGENA